MISENGQLSENIYVGDVVVISGIRPAGRIYSKRKSGRSKHGFLYIWSGEAAVDLGRGRSLKISEGHLVYLPKNLKYKLQYTGENTTFVVVNFELYRENMQPFALAEDITVMGRDNGIYTIANIMSKLEMCSAAQNMAGQFRRNELLFRLLGAVFSDNEMFAEQQYPQITKGVLLMKQTYLESLPVEMFAKQCNMSESAFRKLFHKQYGMSPLQYRNRLRINRARQLLEYDHCTVAEAAYASGFENLGYFCRYYKKITGETPKQTKQKSL